MIGVAMRYDGFWPGWLWHGRELCFGFGWVGDIRCTVVVDADVSSEEETADAGEDSGATGGDAIFGDELKEIGEDEIDALRGLKTLREPEEKFGTVRLGGQRLSKAGVMRTERDSAEAGRRHCLYRQSGAGSAAAELAMLLMGLRLELMTDLDG